MNIHRPMKRRRGEKLEQCITHLCVPMFMLVDLYLLLQLNNVDGVRKQLEAQTNDLRQTIEDKLRSAEENRTENLGKMLEKLKEHVSVG